MTQSPRITLHIDRLRIHGANGGDAAAMVESLKAALGAQIAANPAALAAQQTDHLQLNLPPTAGHGPAAIGRAAGQQVAGALTRPQQGDG